MTKSLRDFEKLIIAAGGCSKNLLIEVLENLSAEIDKTPDGPRKDWWLKLCRIVDAIGEMRFGKECKWDEVSPAAKHDKMVLRAMVENVIYLQKGKLN
jgi:hypothetical protein